MRDVSLRPFLPLVLLAVVTTGAGPCGGSTASQKECSTDADCGYGKYCGAGQCHRYAWFCATASVSMNDRGEWRDCDVYQCDPGTGLCPSTADGSGGCANGALWDPTISQCVCPPNTPCGGSFAPPAYDLSGYKACSVDADCGASEMCWRDPGVQSPAPICVSRGSYCGFDAYGAASFSPGATLDSQGNLVRTATSCGVYGCNAVTGDCLALCISSWDCQGGTSCVLPAQVCATAIQ